MRVNVTNCKSFAFICFCFKLNCMLIKYYHFIITQGSAHIQKKTLKVLKPINCSLVLLVAFTSDKCGQLLSNRIYQSLNKQANQIIQFFNTKFSSKNDLVAISMLFSKLMENQYIKSPLTFLWLAGSYPPPINHDVNKQAAIEKRNR